MRVSIIIPVYNAEKYLKDCLDSVLAQTYTDYEVILINDGSTDNSRNICEDYADKSDVISCYHIENSGPSVARNVALKKAEGEFIQFLDADDTLDPMALEIFYNFTKRHRSDLYVANSVIMNEKLEEIGVIKNSEYGSYGIKEVLNNLNADNKPFFLHYIWNKWYKKKIIDEYQIKFNKSIKLGEDFLFNCEYYKKCKSVYLLIEKLHYYYIRNNESLTHKFRKNEFERRSLLDNEFIKLFKYFNIYNENKGKIYAMIGNISCDSLLSVYNDDCDYNKNKRIQFMKEFLESGYYEYIIKYFESNKSKSHKENMKRKLIRNKRYNMIDLYFIIRKKKWYLWR